MFGYITEARAEKRAYSRGEAEKLYALSKINGENVYHSIMKNSIGESSYAAWNMLPADYQKVYIGIAENLRTRIEKELS